MIWDRLAEQQAARELAALSLISRSISSTLHLTALTNLIMDQTMVAVPADSVHLYLLEGEFLKLHSYRGNWTTTETRNVRIPLQDAPTIREALESRDPVIVPDMHQEDPLAKEVQAHLDTWGLRDGFDALRNLIYVPLCVKDRVLGALLLTQRKPDLFTLHNLSIAVALASHLAMAIDNSQLYQRAQSLALFEERQRLARELHDSVSQALYSISLGARTARAQLDREPALAIQPMDFVISLADSALSEMRALIFELRPESLEREGLASILEKMVTALNLRYKLAVSTDFKKFDGSRLNSDQKYALQRIAQECFHNTVKHGHASHVTISLSTSDNEVIMVCSDDGRGFVSSQQFPGHLGLTSMRERAEGRFGSLTLNSAPGSGTIVTTRLPLY